MSKQDGFRLNFTKEHFLKGIKGNKESNRKEAAGIEERQRRYKLRLSGDRKATKPYNNKGIMLPYIR